MRASTQDPAILTLVLTVVLSPAGCGDGSSLPGPVKGTWTGAAGDAAWETVIVADTAIRLERSLGQGEIHILFTGTSYEPEGDHVRVEFQRFEWPMFGRRYTPDSTYASSDEVFTHPDSVLGGPGRLVLVPRPDSSLTVAILTDAFPADSLVHALARYTERDWPEAANEVKELNGWTADVRFSDYQ